MTWEDQHGKTTLPFSERKSAPGNAVRSSLSTLSMGVTTSDEDTKKTPGDIKKFLGDVLRAAPRYTKHRPPPVRVNSPRTRESSDRCLTWFCTWARYPCSCEGTEDGQEEKDAGRGCVSVDAVGFACCVLCLAVAPVL